MAHGASAPTGLPVRAVVLGRRVRVLVAVTVAHAGAGGALSWAVGDGLTGPGLVGLGVHLAVSLAAALPVWWQFAGDPAARLHRAVRAMAVSFVVLAVYSTVDAVRDAAAPPLPGEPAVGAVLALLTVAALAALARRERREAPDPAPGTPAGGVPAPALASAVVLVAVAALDLLTGTVLAGPAVSAVVAVLAAREAVLEVTARDGRPDP